MAGRIEIEEKPDVLWDNPQVERLHARLADEYELKERATALTRKLRVIDETTHALTDLIDTERSMRLEATIVALIVVEILIAFYDLFSPAAVPVRYRTLCRLLDRSLTSLTKSANLPASVLGIASKYVNATRNGWANLV